MDLGVGFGLFLVVLMAAATTDALGEVVKALARPLRSRHPKTASPPHPIELLR